MSPPGEIGRDAGPVPRTILLINDFALTTGGADKVALTEAVGLADRGHRVVLVAGHGEPDPALLDAGVEVHSLGQPTTLSDPLRVRAASRGVWNRAAAALVRRVVASLDPGSSVVHLHGYTKVLSASVVRAAVDSALPTVATLHDYFAACPNGGFFNYQRDHTCPLTPLSVQCVTTHCDARAYSHKLWRVARSAVQRGPGGMPSGVRHFISPSRFAAGILEPFLPGSAHLHILPNPVAVGRHPAVDIPQNRAFAFVGRLERDKDPRTFARAARAAGVKAVFAGDGAEAGALSRAYPEASFTGWLDAEGVRATLRSARALVCPSSWYEVQPLAPLEAAAQGVPAIVSDVGAFREAVSDGVTGLWFRGGDAGDLAEKLDLLNRDSELSARLGRSAYEAFWSEPRDVEVHLTRLESIYAQLRPA